MAELSSLLFVQTDELNRPTLIASNDTDNLTSSLMPQDVKDTVFIVSSSKVSSNYTAWDSVSAVSGLQELSGVSADVSVIGEISGVIYDGSDGWNSVSAVSGLSALADVSADISAISEISGVMYDNSTSWNSVSSVSGLQELSSVSGDISAVSSLSALLEDGSGILSGLSGAKANGMVRAASLRGLDEKVRVVSVNGLVRTEDPTGDTILLSGMGAITCANDSGDTLTLAGGPLRNSSLKLQPGIGYISSLSAGLIGREDILFAKYTQADVPATVYSSLYTLADDTQAVSGVVDTGSGVMVTLSGDRGDGFSKAEALSALEKVLYTTNPSDPEGNTIKIGTAQGLSAEALRITGKDNVAFVSEMDLFYVGSALGGGEFTQYTTEDFVKVKDTKDYIVGSNVSASLDSSTNWESTYTSVGNTSGNWEGTYTSVNNTSGDWDSTYTSVNNTSGNWDSTYNDVNASANGVWNRTRDTVFDNSGSWGTGGGGGDTQEASALKITGGSPPYTYASINGSAAEGDFLVFNGTNFFYRTAAFAGEAGPPGTPLTFTAPSGDVTYNFGPSASVAGGNTLDFSGSFTSSGATKTLLEFDDKSRVALGRNSVPLEISAFGESDVRLEDDGTDGAFVLIKGSKPGDVPNLSKVHLESADLSADADCQIDFDTDINMGGSTHLVGNTIGANHIACKNEHGSTLTAGTPVYIKGFVGSGAAGKIEIGAASASVASAMPAIGVLSEDLDDGIEGYVDAFGVADKIDTQTPGFALQDTLYVAPTGGLTNVRPTATSDLVQNIGIVERVDSSNGKIIVLGPGRTNDVPTSVNNEVTFASAITVNNTLTANGGTGSTHPTAGGQVLQSRGSNSVTWGNKKKLRWYESDFHSADVRINGPWLGAAINSGTTGGGPAAALYAEMMGAVLLRSSTTANSGYRWDTQALDRIAPRKNLFFECIFAIPDDLTNKTAKLGFYDDATNTTAGVDGTYFLIDNSGNMTPETSNNSTRTTGTSYSLSVDTVYKAQIWWNGSSSVVFKITNMDESTVHASELINTNVPSGTTRRFGAGLVTKSSGTATDDLLVLDYMGWGLYPYREDDSL